MTVIFRLQQAKTKCIMPFLHFKSVKSDWIALILSFCLLQSKNNDRLYFKVDCFWTKICDSDHCV